MPLHLWVHLSGNGTHTTNKFKPGSRQTMSICIQQQWNAIVWTSRAVGWPHWRKQGDQLPDRRGSLRVSGTSTPTKAEWNSPINSISAGEQKTLHQWNFTFDFFGLICKEKENVVITSCQKRPQGFKGLGKLVNPQRCCFLSHTHTEKFF